MRTRSENKWLHKIHPHSSRADPILEEIMRMLDKCSASNDNGKWGCVGCGVYRRCERLTNVYISESIKHKLSIPDLMNFSARFMSVRGNDGG